MCCGLLSLKSTLLIRRTTRRGVALVTARRQVRRGQLAGSPHRPAYRASWSLDPSAVSAKMEEADRQIRVIHALATKENFQENIQHFYEEWAENYDQDMNQSHYGGPASGAEALAKVVADKTAPVVDCAAGTGKVGEELSKRGFSNIDAVDFSQKCLDISAKKGVYKKLICDKLGKNKLKGIEDGYYTGVICVGAISIGHLSHDVFPEWNRIVKKGGFIVFTRSKLIYPDGPEGHSGTMDEIQEAIDDLVRTGVWEVVDVVGMDNSFCVGYGANVYTIRRL